MDDDLIPSTNLPSKELVDERKEQAEEIIKDLQKPKAAKKPKKPKKDPSDKPKKPFTGRKRSMTLTFPSYEIAKLVARQVPGPLASFAQYKAWHIANSITHVPARPDLKYKEEWEGWGEFLGSGNEFRAINKSYNNPVYIPFWEAAKWVHTLELDNSKSWAMYCKENKLPDGVPRYPEKAYKGQFEGWGKWLGQRRQQNSSELVSVVEAKVEAAVRSRDILYVTLTWQKDDPAQGVFTLNTFNNRVAMQEFIELADFNQFLGQYDISLMEDRDLFKQLMEIHADSWYGMTDKYKAKNWNALKFAMDTKLLIVK